MTLRPRISLKNLITYDKLTVILCSYLLNTIRAAWLKEGKGDRMSAYKDPDFQRRSTETGTLFERLCGAHLNSLGFHLFPKKRQIKEAGIKVDHVAVNNRGKEIYFECKGGYEGNRPGLIRTDNTKKMLANAFLLHLCGRGPLVVMTTARPKEGSDSDRMIRRATEEIPEIIFDIIELGDAVDRKRLKELLDMDDFSKPRVPRPVAQVGVSKTGRRESPSLPSDHAVQVAWHSDPKLLDASKKKHRKAPPDKKKPKVSAKKKRKRGDGTLPLFDEE